MRRRLTLLGATGSVGDSTLDVVARHPERFAIAALAAHRNHAKLLTLCRRFRPPIAALADVEAARALARALASESIPTRVVEGPEGLLEAATLPDVDTVLAAIVGAVGLPATLAAARAGKRILLANKEALVIGGALFMDAVAASGATLLPIDSEHNAVFQCLPPAYARNPAAVGVRRILLTASGGPFHPHPDVDFDAVTPAQACAHPNWSMGRKISVDSATMMNKGLEVIEARWLFGLAPSQIDIVVHRQSIVHSLVEYVDGSVLAQLSNPDMRTPIAQALGAPERVDCGVTPLDLAQIATLTFEPPDTDRFPCIRLAYEALAGEPAAPIALNAANEVAVDAFLNGRARFTDIPRVCEAVLARRADAPIASLDDALAADAEAREIARGVLHIGNRPVAPGPRSSISAPR
ncbi:MAG TPA: 1-deoxy-D-xylulose-5-phosphate reductoisomerase [Casimicrobiaceae bacterium]|jgi:1-deoxy-D-xylulose-5-phosphate reductoisomerase|nr:1-deoxy-D-xylulose-5-phosphate reductoisomerase [Casimicrobiaceae bacterium]